MADYIDINPFKALDSIVDQFPNVFYPYEFEMKLKEQRKLHFRKLKWHYVRLVLGWGLFASFIYLTQI